MPVYLYFQAESGWEDFGRQLQGAWWMIAYLAVISVLSWAGSREFEGQGYLSYGWDQLCVALASLAFFYWGVHSGWHTPALAAIDKPTGPGRG